MHSSSHLPIDQLAESYRLACRKPQDLEGWAFDNVPGLLAALKGLTTPLDSTALPAEQTTKLGRMLRISALIVELQELQSKWGDTCVYVTGLSWGSVALNRFSDDEKAEAKPKKKAAKLKSKGKK